MGDLNSARVPPWLGGEKKKEEKGNSSLFFHHLPRHFFPPPCKVEIVSLSPALLHFYRAVNAIVQKSRHLRDRYQLPDTSGETKRALFFLPRFARRSQKLVNHTETASWEICSDTLGQLKYPKVGEKLAHSPCPPPCGGSDAQQFLQQALINLIRRPWQICGGKKIGEHVLLLSRFIHSSIRPPIFWHGRADRFLDDSENH